MLLIVKAIAYLLILCDQVILQNVFTNKTNLLETVVCCSFLSSYCDYDIILGCLCKLLQ